MKLKRPDVWYDNETMGDDLRLEANVSCHLYYFSHFDEQKCREYTDSLIEKTDGDTKAMHENNVELLSHIGYGLVKENLSIFPDYIRKVLNSRYFDCEDYNRPIATLTEFLRGFLRIGEREYIVYNRKAGVCMFNAFDDWLAEDTDMYAVYGFSVTEDGLCIYTEPALVNYFTEGRDPELEKELNMWATCYLLLNDANREHMEYAALSNGLFHMSAAEVHQRNIEDIAKNVYYLKLHQYSISDDFIPYIEEIEI